MEALLPCRASSLWLLCADPNGLGVYTWRAGLAEDGVGGDRNLSYGDALPRLMQINDDLHHAERY